MAGEGAARSQLPQRFIEHNQEDPAWLDALPNLLQQLARRWALRIAPPFPEIAFNYVAPAWRASGEPCVIKVSRHLEETRSEIGALSVWDGRGAVRVLEADPEVGALLIERVEPGETLVKVADADDEAATRVAARLLQKLWLPVPEPTDLRPLSRWCEAFDRNRAALSRGDRGFPAPLFQRADALRRDLLASTRDAVVLHGDLHHHNVLRSHREPWLAIDPKGLYGDRYFDICQFLRNPRPVSAEMNRRRLGILTDDLGLDRARAAAWCFVHAVLDACWDFEDGNDWAETIGYAEETRTYV